MENSYTPIKTFKDLHVYQNLYEAMKIVHLQIITKLPKEEKYDLVDQMRRASKACTALLAEGFAKRYQIKFWKKYLIDCMGECYEMINHLTVCNDIYPKISNPSVKKVIDLYEISCKQLTKLSQSWENYHNHA